ncbi:hypothetical protein HPB50_014119 [Hyalomma asiaticum]|uniref:Uncharacterized protein n=1 Tax=Hyalomma asiaticum TaxID=266040 RepID=A0ACB7S1G1_HYAAI|nr:hypothetical protein HPB50_014119 [Hyalomma asiaticum]
MCQLCLMPPGRKGVIKATMEWAQSLDTGALPRFRSYFRTTAMLAVSAGTLERMKRTTVETATALAVLWYNKGHRGFEKLLEGIGILPSQDLATHGDHCDVMRIRKMNLKQTAEARAHRRNTAKRARVEDTDRKSREGPSYGAGDF